MALSGLVSIAGCLFLSCLVNGQDELPPCNMALFAAGTTNMQHPRSLEKFLMCAADGQRFEVVCAAGTAYNNASGRCDHPPNARGAAWPCGPGQRGYQYPSLCCNAYYVCNENGGYNLVTCNGGQTFSRGSTPTNGGCSQSGSNCERDKECKMPSQTPYTKDPRINCTEEVDPTTPCNFVSRVGGERWVRQCAAGTAWDPANCTCGHSNQSCSMADTSSAAEKVPDVNCQATLKYQFSNTDSNGEVFGRSDKTNRRREDRLLLAGGQISNGVAIMNPQTSAPSYAYAWSSVSKPYYGGVVISITFRLSVQGTYIFINNDLNGACIPTVTLTVVYNGNSYVASATITGESEVGNQVVRATANLNAQLNAGSNDFIQYQIILTPAGQSQIALINKGPSGTTTNGSPALSQLSGFIGTYLAPNQCGYCFAKNVPGAIYSINFHEGCADPSRSRI